ncbi:Gfo/Idh/MocA family oxidoreductase [Curtobacterium flaccumfaciens]|nr:Gfo/Idh/MocA family oxidoreductase [Curtobacterium flaccumfaciens]
MPPLDYLRVSGGQLRDQTVHFFDLVRWITGEDPVTVAVAGSALVDPAIREFGDVDTSVTTLTMPSGALVQIDSVRRTGYGYDERIEVMGSSGLVESRRNHRGNVARYTDGQIVADGLHDGWFERVQPTYAATLAAFVASLGVRIRAAGLPGGRAQGPGHRRGGHSCPVVGTDGAHRLLTPGRPSRTRAGRIDDHGRTGLHRAALRPSRDLRQHPLGGRRRPPAA